MWPVPVVNDMTEQTAPLVYWYFDPENLIAPARRVHMGTADQCGMSAPYRSKQVAEAERQHAYLASLPFAWALAQDTREINTANGWGLTFTLADIPRCLALIHSEITEAAEEQLPSMILRELGDVIVRCLDLSWLIDEEHTRRLNDQPLERFQGVWREDNPLGLWPAGALLYMHTLTSRALETYRKTPDEAEMAHDVIVALHKLIKYTVDTMRAVQDDVEPTQIIQGILEANRQRAYRHGGRRT